MSAGCQSKKVSLSIIYYLMALCFYFFIYLNSNGDQFWVTDQELTKVRSSDWKMNSVIKTKL